MTTILKLGVWAAVLAPIGLNAAGMETLAQTGGVDGTAMTGLIMVLVGLGAFRKKKNTLNLPLGHSRGRHR